MRVNVDVEDFLVDMELSGKKDKTVDDYFRLLSKFFREVDRASAESVEVGDVRRFLLKLKKECSHNTYFIYVWKLRKFFSKEKFPVIYGFLKKIKVKLKKTDVRPFSRKELLAIAEYFKVYRSGPHTEKMYYALSLFLPVVGGRIGEVCGLNVGDLKEEKEFLMIHFRPEITKTGESRKSDPSILRDSLEYKALIDYLKSRGKLKDEDPLFVNRYGLRLKPSSVERKYREARRALGLKKKCTPHVNRHTFATACREAGVDKEIVKAWLGHTKSSPMLDDIYDHPTEKRWKDARKKVKIV